MRPVHGSYIYLQAFRVDRLGCWIFALLISIISSPEKQGKRILAYIVLGALIFMPIGASLFIWGLDNVGNMSARWDHKFSSQAFDDFEDGFLADNIRAGLAAFGDNPFFGAGLGNVELNYFSHEIHSTYLAILATGGVFGILTYLYFVSVLIRETRSYKSENIGIPSRFLYYILPLLLGMMVSWAYTYHLRKREFWVLAGFIVVMSTLARYGGKRRIKEHTT